MCRAVHLRHSCHRTCRQRENPIAYFYCHNENAHVTHNKCPQASIEVFNVATPCSTCYKEERKWTRDKIERLEYRLMMERVGRGFGGRVEGGGIEELAPDGWFRNALSRRWSQSTTASSSGANNVVRNFSRPFRQLLPPIELKTRVKPCQKRPSSELMVYRGLTTNRSNEGTRYLSNSPPGAPRRPDTPRLNQQDFGFPGFTSLPLQTEIPKTPDNPRPKQRGFQSPGSANHPSLSEIPRIPDDFRPEQRQVQFPDLTSRPDTPRPSQYDGDFHDLSSQPVTGIATLSRLRYAKPQIVSHHGTRGRPTSRSPRSRNRRSESPSPSRTTYRQRSPLKHYDEEIQTRVNSQGT